MDTEFLLEILSGIGCPAKRKLPKAPQKFRFFSKALKSHELHDLVEIDFPCPFHDGDGVIQPQNAATTAGKQLENSHTNIAQHESIDSKSTDENGYELNDQRVMERQTIQHTFLAFRETTHFGPQSRNFFLREILAIRKKILVDFICLHTNLLLSFLLKPAFISPLHSQRCYGGGYDFPGTANRPAWRRFRHHICVRIWASPSQLVGDAGLEPTASCSQSRRATSCANPRNYSSHTSLAFSSNKAISVQPSEN